MLNINGQEHSLDEIDENWVRQQVRERRRCGVPFRVQIRVEHRKAQMRLVCPPEPGAGGRPPNDCERGIFNIWEHCHLNGCDFDIDDLIHFLRELRSRLN